jgi:FHA domain
MKSIGAVAAAVFLGIWASPAHAGAADVLERLFGAEAAEVWRASSIWIGERYQEAPELVLGVSAALALPLVAALGLGLHVLIGRRAAIRASREGRATRTIPPSSWRKAGQIEVVDQRGLVRFNIAHDLIRIGRAEDNDIRLAHNTVHRYHAVVEKSAEMAFTIVDLSGGSGNGVRVHGVPVTQAPLADGDVFEVGKVSLRFHLTEVD